MTHNRRSLLIHNIGAFLTGRLAAPISDATALRVEDGLVTDIGDAASIGGADIVVDAKGVCVGPGLIDSHCHVVFGDYTPRQKTVGFLESYVHGGITSVISPGEIHLPGRPHDASGVKALAVLAQRSWAVVRPGGMRVHGGSVVMEPSLTRDDWEELADEGVWLAKFGFGKFANPVDGVESVRWAQEFGIKVMCHSGGASIPGSSAISADDLLELRPDVCGHINGGPTSLNEEGVKRLMLETHCYMQLVQAGCLRSSLEIVRDAQEHGMEERILLGSDTPTGTGVMPLGMLKSVAELASLSDAEPAEVWAWASGNIAEAYGLDEGIIDVGRPANLCVFDAPYGSQASTGLAALRRGDLPGICMVVIDGEIRVDTSRNSPRPSTELQTRSLSQ